jgi:heme exporter protein D
MLLIIYNAREYAAPQGPLWLAVAIVAVLLLLAFAVAAFVPPKRVIEEELARQERIKAQSRELRAGRR